MKPALLLALAALAAISIAEAFLIRRQEARLRDLEAAVARQSSPEGAAELLRKAAADPSRPAETGTPPAASATAAAREAAEAAVAERTAELEKRLAALEKGSAGAVAGGAGGDPAAIDDLVSKKVDEKMQGEKKKKGGLFGDDNKRPLADVSRDLGLNEIQEDQMAEAINASQKLCFGIVTTPRADGTNVLDDIVVAMQDPEHAEEKVKAAFMQIFTARLPGSDETYLGKILAEKKVLLDQFKTILTGDQMKKFDRLGQDPTQIQTGYDPYGEYLAQRLGKK